MKIPAKLKIKNWKDIQPYFEELLGRDVKNKKELEKWLVDYSDVVTFYREQDSWASINMTRHTDNKDYVALYETYGSEIRPKIEEISNKLDKKLLGHPAFGKLSNKRYGQLKKRFKQEQKLFNSKNLSLKAELSQLSLKFNQISGGLTVEFDGKKYTPPQMQAFMQSRDRSIREKAWRALSQARFSLKPRLDEVFDHMLKIRHQIALNSGYKNFRDYQHDAYLRFDYKIKDTLNFHTSVKNQFLPLLKTLHKNKADTLSLGSDLRPWDLDAEIHDPLKPFQSVSELLKKTIGIFSKLDKQFGENLKKMNKRGFFDLESRENKSPGGYNTTLELTGMPFIFMNAANTHRDMTTLMHEGGHAMQSFLMTKEKMVFYRDIPMEVAEVASMSMELMSSHLWDSFYTNTNELKRAHLDRWEDIIAFFPWCAIVDKFQHWIYLNPDHSVQERDTYFGSLMDEFSSGLVNWDGLESLKNNFWQKQLHIFEVPFYYIEYGFAQLGALQIYRNFLKNKKKTLAQYKKGLSIGCAKPIPQVWKELGIKFDFSQKNVKVLKEFISEQIEKDKIR